MPQYLLGIDNGCTMAKAALFTIDGQEVAVASRKSDMLDTQPGWAEFDMNRIWANAAEAIRETLEKAGVDPNDITCVACAGHGNGLYLVDEHGKPVRNAIGSADARARQYIEQWTADDVLSRVRPKTMQAIWPAQPNALLCWLADHEPESLEKARWVLMCKDFVRAQLTGEVYMELTDMSGTSLMNVGTAEYDDEVLETWGLTNIKDMLPPLRNSADLCGKVTPAAAKATGLAEGTPVAAGLFDIDACGLASGMVDEEALCMVAGTWGCNQYAARKPVISEDVFMTSCYSVPGYYLMLEGSPTSASNLEWFVTQFFQAEQDKAVAEGRSVYDLCNDLVAGTQAKDSGSSSSPSFMDPTSVSTARPAFLDSTDGRPASTCCAPSMRESSSLTSGTSTASSSSAPCPPAFASQVAPLVAKSGHRCSPTSSRSPSKCLTVPSSVPWALPSVPLLRRASILATKRPVRPWSTYREPTNPIPTWLSAIERNTIATSKCSTFWPRLGRKWYGSKAPSICLTLPPGNIPWGECGQVVVSSSGQSVGRCCLRRWYVSGSGGI